MSTELKLVIPQAKNASWSALHNLAVEARAFEEINSSGLRNLVADPGPVVRDVNVLEVAQWATNNLRPESEWLFDRARPGLLF